MCSIESQLKTFLDWTLTTAPTLTSSPLPRINIFSSPVRGSAVFSRRNFPLPRTCFVQIAQHHETLVAPTLLARCLTKWKPGSVTFYTCRPRLLNFTTRKLSALWDTFQVKGRNLAENAATPPTPQLGVRTILVVNNSLTCCCKRTSENKKIEIT